MQKKDANIHIVLKCTLYNGHLKKVYPLRGIFVYNEIK